MPLTTALGGAILLFVSSWLAVESLFWLVVHFFIVPRLQTLEQPPEYPMDGEELMMRCMETLDWLQSNGAAYSFDDFVKGWFRGASVGDVREDNVFEFLSWAMFAADYEKLPEERKAKVSSARAMLEGRYNIRFAPGRNKDLQCMRTSLEPVHYCHHPLVWYALLGVARTANEFWMCRHGFRKHHAACGMVYWHRPLEAAPPAKARRAAATRSEAAGAGAVAAASAVAAVAGAGSTADSTAETAGKAGGRHRRGAGGNGSGGTSCGSSGDDAVSPCRPMGRLGLGSFFGKEEELGAEGASGDGAEQGGQKPPLPLIFFHGIGLGLPIYTYMLKRMCRGRTAIVVETPSISMTLHHFRQHRPPSPPEFVGSVRGILTRHGINGALFVGHSFGSVGVAWMAKMAADVVTQVGLIDPVCLLLFLPDVASNFLYAHDKFPDMTLRQRALKRLVAQEKGITHTLRRHFWWYHNNLWPEDLKCPAVVGVASEDEIAPARAIQHYVEGWESHSPGHCVRKKSSNVKPVELLWWPGLVHGRSLFHATCLDDFMEAVNEQARLYGLSGPPALQDASVAPDEPPTPQHRVDHGTIKAEPAKQLASSPLRPLEASGILLS